MKNIFRRSIRSSLGFIAAALPLALLAQESDNEVYELSPFSVDAEETIGYRATSTLAGTRLNTQLKDLGSAITVLTDELFDDTGATDAASILAYAPSSEVGGVQGNFAGSGIDSARADSSSQRINPQANQRIRGLASASLTRNYFLTDIPFDTYNSTRVTMNRGPNSLLFGIGSPGGVINNGIQGAFLGRDFGEVSIRIGKRSSHRETFDYNKELIEGRLAVRLSGLHDDTQYQQRPAFEIDKRVTAAVEAVLFRNENSNFLGKTTLRGNYESGSIHGTPPNVIPPSDGGLSDWFSPPDPAIQNVTATTFPDWVTDGSFVPKLTIDDREVSFSRNTTPGSTIEPGFVQNFIVFNQPNAQSAGIGLADSSIDGMMFNMKFQLATEGPNVGRPQFNMFRTASFYSGNYTPGFAVPSIQDRNVFDNENNLITGKTNSTSNDFDARNIVLEQLFLEGDAGIEIAYDLQHNDREWQLPFSSPGRNGGGTGNYDVAIDISEYLGNGEPNPNLGRPYILDAPYGSFNTSSTDREAYRATGFYSIDFAEKSDNLKWLGKHNFTGLFGEQTIDGLSKGFGSSWVNDRTDVRTNHENAGINTFFTNVIAIAYVGDDQRGAQSYSDIRIADHLSIPVSKDGDTHKITYYDRASGLVQTSDSFSVRKTLNSGNIDRQKVESEVFSWQSYFLNGNVVGLAGWRTDTSTVFERLSNNRLPSGIYDENNLVLKQDPVSELSGDTFTWSVVGHLPVDLPGGSRVSVHYGESENFEPVGIQRSSFGEILPPPSGTTKEYGFTLGLLKDKVSMRFNWFETDSKGANANMPRINLVSTHGASLFSRYINAANSGMTLDEVLEFAGGPDAVGTYSSLQELFDDLNALNDPRANAIRNPRIEDGVVRIEGIPGETATTDFVAEGFEFELVGNITPSWRVFFNVAKQETFQSNVAPEYRELLEHIKGTLAASKFANWKGSPAPAEDFTFTDFLAFRAVNPSAPVLAKEGNLNQELRKWRWNLITAYDFSEESPMKGFSAGAGIRWQDAVATGYPNIINSDGLAVPDLSRPFFDGEQLNGDLWLGYRHKLNNKVDWKVQLNARNAFGDSDPITVITNADGRVAVIRNPNPKDVFLTNTFSF